MLVVVVYSSMIADCVLHQSKWRLLLYYNVAKLKPLE